MVTNILVTGSTGYIGRNFLKYIHSNYNVKTFSIIRPNSNRLSTIKQDDNSKFLISNLNDLETNLVLKNTSIDIVFHFAWEGSYGAFRNDKEIQKKNFDESTKLIDYCINNNVQKIFISGSQEEYHRKTYYGIYKAKLLEFLQLKSTKRNLNYNWGRIFSVFGLDENDENLVPTSIKRIQSSLPLKINYPYKQWNLIYIRDCVKLIFKSALELKGNNEFDIGSSKNQFIHNYISQIGQFLKAEPILQFDNLNEILLPKSLDFFKIYKLLKLNEDFSFIDALKDYVKI
jgi:nucleoside-diphosphate-sugar epimerase